ncbi:MAG: sigma-70 family RNA polymerase sigma factor [Pseudomonadota bacterium]|nr:sigma-70 family RNA polymerase sigma factor [Pseudomonadota bacterium]
MRSDGQPGQSGRVFDELLVTLARTGDRAAGDRLAARWQPRLIRTARRLLRDDELAREAVQEAWAGICRGWFALDDPAKFPAWAFGVLHRKCADRLRAEVRRRGRDAPLDGETLAAPSGDADMAISIDQALAALSPDHRAAAVLFFGEGLSLAEIAAATGAPVGTAKSRLFHARRQLKAALSGDQP